MKLLCIDASRKPKEIPDHLWIEKGETYEVEKYFFDKGGEAVILRSPKLTSECLPHRGFPLNRFVIVDTSESKPIFRRREFHR